MTTAFCRAVLADTSVLYALVDPRDQNSARARRDVQQLSGERYRVLVAYATLQEAHALVLHRLRPAAALRWLREVQRGTDLLNVPATDYAAAIKLTERYGDQTITLHDLTLNVVSKTLGVPVWTFDADFDVMGAAVWRGS